MNRSVCKRLDKLKSPLRIVEARVYLGKNDDYLDREFSFDYSYCAGVSVGEWGWLSGSEWILVSVGPPYDSGKPYL